MSGYRFDDSPETAVKLQRLAREQMKQRLLQDILMDITICKLEGFDYKEYLLELKSEIDVFIKQEK